MRKLYILSVCVTTFICTVTHAQTVGLTTINAAYTQDFNTLVNTGTGTLAANVPAGWLFSETIQQPTARAMVAIPIALAPAPLPKGLSAAYYQAA